MGIYITFIYSTLQHKMVDNNNLKSNNGNNNINDNCLVAQSLNILPSIRKIK